MSVSPIVSQCLYDYMSELLFLHSNYKMIAIEHLLLQFQYMSSAERSVVQIICIESMPLKALLPSLRESSLILVVLQWCSAMHFMLCANVAAQRCEQCC